MGGPKASYVSSVILNYDLGRHVNDFNLEPVSYAEVYKALKAIDTKKSAGPDNLDRYLLTSWWQGAVFSRPDEMHSQIQLPATHPQKIRYAYYLNHVCEHNRTYLAGETLRSLSFQWAFIGNPDI